MRQYEKTVTSKEENEYRNDWRMIVIRNEYVNTKWF